MSNPLSPECLRDTRLFFLTPAGKEFYSYLESQRPKVVPDSNVHLFAFSAGKPAGYDMIMNEIDTVLEYKKPAREAKPDTLHD